MEPARLGRTLLRLVAVPQEIWKRAQCTSTVPDQMHTLTRLCTIDPRV